MLKHIEASDSVIAAMALRLLASCQKLQVILYYTIDILYATIEYYPIPYEKILYPYDTVLYYTVLYDILLYYNVYKILL